MEDLEIEPGICATRIRCYTEGAIQRPTTAVRKQTATVGETLYRSASSLLVSRTSESSSSSRELCRSCDQLPREALTRTFVSSVNIALTNPLVVTRKLSLPAASRDVRLSAGQPPMLRPAVSAGSIPQGCSSSTSVGEDGPLPALPWDSSEDFPHVPVLERIKEFERQTGGGRSPTPGKWKRKGRGRWGKSSTNGHSSSATSPRGSLTDSISVRNSRNSSPTILRLHLPDPKLPHEGASQGESSDRASPTTVSMSCVVRASCVRASPEESPSCQLDGRAKAADERTDPSLEDSKPASCSSDSSPADIKSDIDSERSSDDQNTVVPSTVPSPEARCPEQAGTLASCRNSTSEGLALPESSAEDPTSLQRTSPGPTESTSDTSHHLPERSDQESQDSHERALPTEDCSPSAVVGDASDETAECERQEPKDVTAEASEVLSGRLAQDASADCQDRTDVACTVADASPEAGVGSATVPPQSTECNSQDAGLSESGTDPEEPAAASQPWIDEILQAGQGADTDTDVYSQRCSLQLGESGCPSSAVRQAASGEEDPTAADSSSPCLSDCYSRSNSSSSSDDESLPSEAQSLADSLRKPDSDSAASLIPESTVWNTRMGEAPLAVLDEFLEPVTSTEASARGAHQEDSLDRVESASESTTDDSSASSSDSEGVESLNCIREVLASDRLPELSASLGACGGVGTSSVDGVALSEADASAFSRHLSALIAGQRRQQQQHGEPAGAAGGQPLNADQALFLSRVNLILAWIHSQQSQPAAHNNSQPALPPAPTKADSFPSQLCDANVSPEASGVDDTSLSATEGKTEAERCPPVVYRAESREERLQLPKRPCRPRRKKFVDPDKVSHLRYLILQSPLVLSDGAASGESDVESDVELNEFGEVKQDYPLGRLPDYIVAQIFGHLPTRALAALKCACKDFKWLIERFDIRGTDSRWSESSLYREDPCMQCGKIRDPRGDVSLCRWHPKIYYKNGEIGRHYWTCCFAGEEDAPGCETSLHDNKWSGSHSRLCKVPRSWRQYWRSYPMDS